MIERETQTDITRKTPEQQLWLAVIETAFTDLFGADAIKRRDAGSWLFDGVHSSDREDVYTLAGVHRVAVQRDLSKLSRAIIWRNAA